MWRFGIQLGALAASLLAASCSVGTSIPWGKDYSAALARARSERLPVITYLYTDWCTYCRQMEVSTFQDPLLTEQMRDRYIWVKLNAETDAEGVRLRDEFAVSGYPTIVVLNSDGDEMDRMQGFIPAELFRSNVERFLTDPNSFGRLLQRTAQQPGSAEAHYNLAQAYLDREHFEAARESLEAAIENSAVDQELIVASSFYYLSYALASMNQVEEALANLDELEQKFPKSPVLADATVLRGQIYVFQGREQEARKVLAQYLEDFPEHGHRQSVTELLGQLQAGSSLSMASSH